MSAPPSMPSPPITDVAEAVPLPDAPEFSRISFGEEQFFLVLAIFIGIFSGLAVVCFHIAIEWSRQMALGSALIPTKTRVITAPALIGLVIAVIVIKLFPRVRGSGVNQTKAALYIYDGYIPFRTAIGKFITSALAIGSGQSLGPEDPSLQIGAAIASALGRRLRLSRAKLRLIAPVGAAAGLAAAFNAPISAVLFVIEEVIGRWSAGIFGAVVLSAVSSVVVTRWFLGSEPLFRIPAVELVQPGELGAYAVLGIIGAFASVLFAKAITYLRARLKSLPHWTQYLQPAAAGLIIGVLGFLGAPQIMGAGYEYIDQAMHNEYTWQVLGIFAALKIIATTLSFASGTPGGMFAPTLFIGAMLGGAVGLFEHGFFPHLTGSTGTYALVGMGVLFAGFLRAPMTSVFMVLEVSGNYSIILPVIIANTLAYLIARSLQPVPIFDILTRQDGLELPSMEEMREEAILRVEDAMRPLNIPVLEGHLSARQGLEQMRPTDQQAIVFDRATGWGTISRESLQQLNSEGKGGLPLARVLPDLRMPPLHPDYTLDAAMHYLGDWPFLPVVHRAEPNKILGVLTLKDVLKTYRRK